MTTWVPSLLFWAALFCVAGTITDVIRPLRRRRAWKRNRKRGC